MKKEPPSLDDLKKQLDDLINDLENDEIQSDIEQGDRAGISCRLRDCLKKLNTFQENIL